MHFKVHRGLIAGGAEEPHLVVKNFDPFENDGPSYGTRGELAVKQPAFERAPEAFHHGVKAQQAYVPQRIPPEASSRSTVLVMLLLPTIALCLFLYFNWKKE